jgi:hypothetical protein
MIYTETDRNIAAHTNLVLPAVNKTENLEYTCFPYSFFALLRNTLALVLIIAASLNVTPRNQIDFTCNIIF